MDREVRRVEPVGGGQAFDGGLVDLVPAVEALENPFEGTAVFAVVRRHEVAVFIAATEVDDDRILVSIKRYTRCSISFATLERGKGRVFIWR